MHPVAAVLHFAAPGQDVEQFRIWGEGRDVLVLAGLRISEQLHRQPARDLFGVPGQDQQVSEGQDGGARTRVTLAERIVQPPDLALAFADRGQVGVQLRLGQRRPVVDERAFEGAGMWHLHDVDVDICGAVLLHAVAGDL